MRKLIFVTSFLFAFAMTSPIFCSGEETDEFDKIADAFKRGDAAKISVYLSETVQLEIVGESDVYSKKQAAQIIKEFFSRNEVSGFYLSHKSGRPPMKYAVGTLETKNGKFRVTFFICTENGTNELRQLRIEPEQQK